MDMELKDYKELFERSRANAWDDIPDIDLYMDQVISYMQRQHIGFEVGEELTASMVNNYVKQKVLPKSNGKKYDRRHIAYLTAIALLKQVVSVGESKTLLGSQLKNHDVSDFYEKYISYLDEKLSNTATMLGDKMNEDELSELALRLAISSYAEKLACECILDTLNHDDEKKKR